MGVASVRKAGLKKSAQKPLWAGESSEAAATATAAAAVADALLRRVSADLEKPPFSMRAEEGMEHSDGEGDDG